MHFVSVLAATTSPHVTSRGQFAVAPRVDVPVFAHYCGLVITPAIGSDVGFTITHADTGLAVPYLAGVPRFSEACAIAEILSDCFPWAANDDVLFFASLPDEHQRALQGCVRALREMFAPEVK